MKSSAIILAIAGVAAASPHFQRQNTHEWKAPGPGDRRSPCPMVNTLANHGYLARNGQNISLNDLITGVTNGVNLAASETESVGVTALTLSTTGYPSTFNLDDLIKHNVLEHDGSLSRNDVYFGDNHSFNVEIFNTVAAFFTNPFIDIPTLAAARKARLAAAKAANPTFYMPAAAIHGSYIESSLLLSILGDRTTVDARFINKLFREERLPIEEGWTRHDTAIDKATLDALVAKLTAATG